MFNIQTYMENKDLSALIIKLETEALEQWNSGNPSGFLELSAEDVVYFDPMQERRLNGYKELETLYEGLRGKAKVERYEMLNPLVQGVENMAVLTFNLNSYSGDSVWKWNCTEVYRCEADGTWKIIHTHWSLVKPLG